MNLNFEKVLVTGGAGFIGSHLAEALAEGQSGKGREVRVVDNFSTGHLSNLGHIKDKIMLYEGDIRDQEFMNRAVKGCDVIFHEAAEVSVTRTVQDPVTSAQINDMGTLQLLETARQNGVKRVVFACSSAVYGDDPHMPKREDMVPKPMSPYAVQKLTGEYYARIYNDLYGLETVSLRYFNVYGPRQDPSSPYSGVISIFMDKAAKKERPVIYGDGGQTRDFVFVKDVVKANLLAASVSGIGGQKFNVGIGSSVSINQLWEMISRMSGLDMAPEQGPPRAGDIRDSLSDISRAQSLLGFSPEYSFEKGLEITMQWYKNQT
ncbi:MAG: SDR family oxidoreductase [Desulfobacterales bacterium]